MDGKTHNRWAAEQLFSRLQNQSGDFLFDAIVAICKRLWYSPFRPNGQHTVARLRQGRV